VPAGPQWQSRARRTSPRKAKSRRLRHRNPKYGGPIARRRRPVPRCSGSPKFLPPPGRSGRGYTLTVSDFDLAALPWRGHFVGADADILSIVESHHSLEDVYLELIDGDVEAKSR
jgi:hypothetical protein